MTAKYWVEHVVNGSVGWMVDAEDYERPVMPPFAGKSVVRLDRPNQVLTKPYHHGQWRPRATAHPLSEIAKAKIAHAALRELAFAMGDHVKGRLEFISIMPEEKRINYAKRGPVALDPAAADDVRQELWEAIFKVLG